MHDFRAVAAKDDRRNKHYLLVYGETPRDPDGRRFAGIRGAPDAEDSNVYWFEECDREWFIVPEANDDGTWTFVFRPSDRRLSISLEQRALRQGKAGRALTREEMRPLLTNSAHWTLCGLPLGPDLEGPEFDRHRLRNYLWTQRGVYTRPCEYCTRAINDVY